MVAVSAGGLLVVDTVGNDTGQGTVMCLIYHVLNTLKVKTMKKKWETAVANLPTHVCSLHAQQQLFKSFLSLESQHHTEELKNSVAFLVQCLNTHVSLSVRRLVFYLKAFQFHPAWSTSKVTEGSKSQEFTWAVHIRKKNPKHNTLNSKKSSKDIKQHICFSNRRQMGGYFKQVRGLVHVGSHR